MTLVTIECLRELLFGHLDPVFVFDHFDPIIWTVFFVFGHFDPVYVEYKIVRFGVSETTSRLIISDGCIGVSR